MRPIVLLIFFVCTATSAAGMNCSTKPGTATRDHELQPLAKISMQDARRIAQAHVKAAPDSKTTGELEVESGCLVYSFDIKMPKKTGVEEVMIDAGTGAVLSRRHETAIQEAAERAKDRLSLKRK
jgi:peptidase YpeB-like protein